MASSIGDAVLEYLDRPVPRHGGMLIDQLETQSGRVVYRRSAGWVLELCLDTNCVHIQKQGWTAYKCASVELFRHAGEERVTPEELEAAAIAEERARLLQDDEAIAEFERAFDSIIPEYLDAPEIEVAAE